VTARCYQFAILLPTVAPSHYRGSATGSPAPKAFTDRLMAMLPATSRESTSTTQK
jgi:hypothetical protein